MFRLDRCDAVRESLRMEETPMERISVGLSEAANLTGLCRRTLEAYIAEKLLPSRKIGKRRMVLMADLKKFVSADRPSPSREF
jgi:excisionase family DNA binding protein